MLKSFDKEPLHDGLLFCLPMREATGVITMDVARPHHPVTQVHAPVWTQLASGIWCMDFDGSNDHLSVAAASCLDLNFTTGAFSAVVWVYRDTQATNMGLMGRSDGATNGWYFWVTPSAGIYITRKHAAGSGVTVAPNSTVSLSTWMLLGFSVPGASAIARIYANGVDSFLTNSGDQKSDSSASNLEIGRMVGANPFDGKLWNPRIWGRALAASEHMTVFQRERELFGV